MVRHKRGKQLSKFAMLFFVLKVFVISIDEFKRCLLIYFLTWLIYLYFKHLNHLTNLTFNANVENFFQ